MFRFPLNCLKFSPNQTNWDKSSILEWYNLQLYKKTFGNLVKLVFWSKFLSKNWIFAKLKSKFLSQFLWWEENLRGFRLQRKSKPHIPGLRNFMKWGFFHSKFSYGSVSEKYVLHFCIVPKVNTVMIIISAWIKYLSEVSHLIYIEKSNLVCQQDYWTLLSNVFHFCLR